ncbi:MAG TPA: FUSC family membrane protein [Puia sp.]|nr:FUSC family membrane protein [Puia sp.]
MDYIRQYKSFINSHYFNGAVRITVGITLPAILLGYLHNLAAGISISIGAMCVGNTDNPGPIHHRRNGMVACIFSIFLVTLLMGLASSSDWLTGLLVLSFCFVFSFIGIYGTRASSIGINALLVMVLNVARPRSGTESLVTALYVLSGGVWYTLLSLMLYSFRPYKLVQQALGDCMGATADYLRAKASFYGDNTDYEDAYRRLLESQVTVHQKQDLVRELIFKSRNVVRESTNIGRVLMMMFLDTIDLFERIMTSQQDYRELHHFFDGTGLMREFRGLILGLAAELDDIGVAVMSGKASVETPGLAARLQSLRERVDAFGRERRTGKNADAFAGLHQILDSIEDLAGRLHTLHGYTTYDRKLAKTFDREVDPDAFVVHQQVDRRLIGENLTIGSNIFRHSLRVSIATIAGYIISRLLPVGHGYWIMLTAIVILKPAYSLTRKRNFQRLAGTLAGALVGLLLLYFIGDRNVLFVLMILFMVAAYTFLRIDYLVFVILMTPYVLLLFHLLYPVDFRTILTDRVIDTLVGSGIAFLANLLIVPSWEHERIIDFMTAAVRANIAYFKDVTAPFTGRPVTVQQYKLSRKNAFVALANLSDALSRMLSEPRSRQKSVPEMHQFVVANHMLTSHVATLAYYSESSPAAERFLYEDAVWRPAVEDIVARLGDTVSVLGDALPGVERPASRDAWRAIHNRVAASKKLRPIADQFAFIDKVTTDIGKVSAPLHETLVTAQQDVGINPLF